MQRPVVVATLLTLGALALAYNIWTYSKLFLKPNSSQVSSVTRAEDSRTDPATNSDQPAPEVEGARPVSQAVLAVVLKQVGSRERNPFYFGGAQRQRTREGEEDLLPVLQGIFRGEGRRIAWVNGRARSEGEELEGYVLSSIEADHVVLVRDGEQWILVPAE